MTDAFAANRDALHDLINGSKDDAEYALMRRENRLVRLAKAALENMIERADDFRDLSELETFCRQQLGGDFDNLMTEEDF